MKAVSCLSLHLLSFIKYTFMCVFVCLIGTVASVRQYSPHPHLVCDKLWVINHVSHSDRDVTVNSCRRAAWVCLIYLCDLSDCRSVMWRLTSVWITWPGKRMRKWAFSTATAWAATRSAPHLFQHIFRVMVLIFTIGLTLMYCDLFHLLRFFRTLPIKRSELMTSVWMCPNSMARLWCSSAITWKATSSGNMTLW